MTSRISSGLNGFTKEAFTRAFCLLPLSESRGATFRGQRVRSVRVEPSTRSHTAGDALYRYETAILQGALVLTEKWLAIRLHTRNAVLFGNTIRERWVAARLGVSRRSRSARDADTASLQKSVSVLGDRRSHGGDPSRLGSGVALAWRVVGSARKSGSEPVCAVETV